MQDDKTELERLRRRLTAGKTFEEAWIEMEAKGYQYGEDALEQVRLGWEIRALIDDDDLERLRRLEAANLALDDALVNGYQETIAPAEHVLTTAIAEARAARAKTDPNWCQGSPSCMCPKCAARAKACSWCKPPGSGKDSCEASGLCLSCNGTGRAEAEGDRG